MAIFDNTSAGSKAFQNVQLLEAAVQQTPDKIFTWAQSLGEKYGQNEKGKGTRTKVNRLKKFTSPTVATLSTYVLGQGRSSIDTSAGNIEGLSYDEVEIELIKYHKPAPVGIKRIALDTSQQDVLSHARFNTLYNRFEFVDLMAREAYRNAVCTNVWGAQKSSAATITNAAADNLSVAVLKELRRRFVTLNVRPFGASLNSDMQQLTGNYVCLTDIYGEHQLTSDAIFREWMVQRSKEDDEKRSSFARGYFGEFHQMAIFRTDSGADATGGASGEVGCSELIAYGSDPVYKGTADDGSMMIGEKPVTHPMIGLVEIVATKDDNFDEDYIFTWKSLEAFKAMEELESDDVTALQLILRGGSSDAKYGTVLTGSHRAIHRAIFSRAV